MGSYVSKYVSKSKFTSQIINSEIVKRFTKVLQVLWLYTA